MSGSVFGDGPIEPACPPGQSCELPTYVEVCNLDEIPLGIEAGIAPVGCIRDANGEVTGKVFLCKIVDEETQAVTWQNYLANASGGDPAPYTGAWEDCGLRQTEIEFLCNADTGFYDQVVVVLDDSVEVSRVVTATTVPCGPLPEIEVTEFCDPASGLLFQQAVTIANDGTLTPIGDPIPTGVPCSQLDVEMVNVCVTIDGVEQSAIMRVQTNTLTGVEVVTFFDNSGDITPDSWVPGICECDKNPVDTCFLPDQYAITWAWNGSGDIMSYDPITGLWTDYGKTTLPDGTVVGGFALTFKNDASEPALFFQTNGTLYKSSPDDPTQLIEVGPANNPNFTSSYPCLAFDPAGRLLVGIGSGSTVGAINETTGEVTTICSLTDPRDGALAQLGPGDWYFDPSGKLFLMARDIRGATFGVSTGTVLWEIDLDTCEATRVGNTDAPSSGTGASWFAAGQGLLSTSSGDVYIYNSLADPAPASPDAWDLLTTAPHGINDLGNQWVIPDPIQVVGWIEAGCDDDDCQGTQLFILSQDPVTFEPTCRPFDLQIGGKFGVCEPESNPFVTDPFDAGGGSEGCEICPDEDWHKGCSDAGVTLWRVGRDSAGQPDMRYLYGTLASPTTSMPPGFTMLECEEVPLAEYTVTPFCNLDVTPNVTVYRRENNNDGTVDWFDQSGAIAQPTTIIAGACDTDPLSPVSEEIICLDGETAVRLEKEFYTTNADGLPELAQFQLIYFNQNGTIYDSGILNAGDSLPSGEPTEWYFGECVNPYVSIDTEKMCEIDARFLLLIDSGGQFARYSFYTKEWEAVSTLSVASAGGSADVANFLLYNFVSPDQMTVIDVNTDTQLPNVTLVDGVIKTGQVTNPKTFSAGAFRDADGSMYAWDTAGGDDGLYRVNVTTGVVDFVTTISGVAGTGTSIMIDNATDTLYINGSDLIYEVDWVTGVGTPWGDPPIRPNGATFDTSGNAYVTQGNDTYQLPAGLDANDPSNWVRIIDDWGPGANSLAYYETVASSPSCFNRRFGVLPNGDRELIGDFNVSDGQPRNIVGDIDCCECACGGGSGDSGGSPSDVNVTNTDINIIDLTPNPDQTHVLVHGANSNVPAGLKSVTVSNLTGVTTVDGVFELGDGRRPNSISYDATEVDRARGLLPAIELNGGTWQWTGLMPIVEQ